MATEARQRSRSIGIRRSARPTLRAHPRAVDLAKLVSARPPHEALAATRKFDPVCIRESAGEDDSEARADGFSISFGDGDPSEVLARLGGPSAMPLKLLEPGVIRSMAFDHRVGFLLSFVDGRSSIEDILDMCGMPSHEVLDVLGMLYERGVIALSSRRSTRP